MIDYFIALSFFGLLILGLRDPAIAYFGYLWADLLSPHRMGWGMSNSLPMSQALAGVCFISIVINFRKLAAPKSFFTLFLLVFFAFWVTFTTYRAHFPESAWVKWDPVIKTLLFITLSVFILHSKRHLDLYLIAIVAFVSYYAISVGLKTGLSGGGYGRQLIRGANNQGLSESSALAGMAAAMIPILMYLKKHTELLSIIKNRAWMWYSGIGVYVLAIIGTGARTGLVALAVLGGMATMFGKRKFAIISMLFIVGALVFTFASKEWTDRMLTIQSPEDDSSALGRIVVWKWTLDFVSDYPLGGGFNSYKANEGQLSRYSEKASENIDDSSKAFHNIFFEVLGEQGYIGFIVYMLIMGITWLKLFRYRYAFGPEKDPDNYFTDAATALLLSFSCILSAGLFVGIAYRPYGFFFVVATLILEREYARIKRAEYNI